jgi:hypothetical protein
MTYTVFDVLCNHVFMFMHVVHGPAICVSGDTSCPKCNAIEESSNLPVGSEGVVAACASGNGMYSLFVRG